MTQEQIKDFAEHMMILIRCEELYKDNEIFKLNARFNPYHSERVGMQMALKTMGIDFEYDYDDEYIITAITIKGIRVEK